MQGGVQVAQRFAREASAATTRNPYQRAASIRGWASASRCQPASRNSSAEDPFRALLNACALTSRRRTAMPFKWPNKVSSSACTLAHIPDIIIAAMRGKVRWRSRVKAPGRRRT